MLGLEPAHDLGDLRGRVLRILRFVEHQRAEAEAFEQLRVEPRQRVGRDHDVVGMDLVVLRGAVAARLKAQRRQRRGELPDLGLPGVRHRGRRDHQHRRGAFDLFAARDVSDQLARLPGSHVVGQDAAEAKRGQVRQEVETAALIVAQRQNHRAGRLDLGNPLEVAQALANALDLFGQRYLAESFVQFVAHRDQ